MAKCAKCGAPVASGHCPTIYNGNWEVVATEESEEGTETELCINCWALWRESTAWKIRHKYLLQDIQGSCRDMIAKVIQMWLDGELD
jgi:hypothetical protein